MTPIPGATSAPELRAYVSRPPVGHGPWPGVVVLHEAFGLTDDIRPQADRLAAAGYLAVAPDLFTARGALRCLQGTFRSMLRRSGPAFGDIEATRQWVAGHPECTGRVGVIGFCSGGRETVLAACRLPVDAAVDCYGAWVLSYPPAEYGLQWEPIRDALPDLRAPLLGMFGNDDRNPTPAEVDELDDLLTALGKPHEFHRYDGAGHAFFSADRPAYRQAAAVDGWQRIRAFFGTHLTG